MISCTEFIPSYSELFSYLEEKHGHCEVNAFWDYLFTPSDTGIPLIRHMKEKGLAGCYSYWSGTLSEEAADFTMCLNEKAGWFLINMRHCPSKGRLLNIKHITQYHDYCLHCDFYRKTVEKFGLKYIYDFTNMDSAACRLLIYDPTTFDGRLIMDKSTLVLDRRASDNKYFHRDFHNSMNMGLEYLGKKYGTDAVKEYLERFTKNYYSPLIEAVRKRGLPALEESILCTYAAEEANDAVKTVLQNGRLMVNVKYCPAVKHLHETDRKVSAWYPYSTETVMRTLAVQTGYRFQMCSYDEETGAAHYQFE